MQPFDTPVDACCQQSPLTPASHSALINQNESACLPADCHDVKDQHAVYAKMLQYCESGDATQLSRLINERRLCLGCLDRQFNPSTNNLSFLNTAAKHGYSDIAQALIWGGLHPDYRCLRSGTTALFDGAYLGHAQFVRRLLDMKADPLIEDADGSNAVYAACYSGQAGVLKELIAFGVKIHYARCSDLRTPMHAAAGGGHLDCLRLLIAAKHPLNCIDEDGLTPLLLAAANGCCDGRKECILALADAKCDVHITDHKGRNVLATILLNPTGCSQCIMHASQMLLSLDPPVSICCRDFDGMSIASELRKLKGKSYGKCSILQTTLQSHPNMQFMFNRALLKEELRAKLELKQKASDAKRGEQGKSLEEQIREAEAAAAALIMDEEESTKKKKKKNSKVKDAAAALSLKDDRAQDKSILAGGNTLSSESKSSSAAAASATPSQGSTAVKERSLSPVNCERGVDCSCSGHSANTESTEATVQLGDESGGGYKSPPPSLIDLTAPLDQEQDDAEILIFKVFQSAASYRPGTRDTAAQAMLTDLFQPAKAGSCRDGDACVPPQPLRLPDSVARSIEQMCSQT